MNIEVSLNDIKLFKTYKYENAFKDVFYIKKDFDLNNIIIQEDEVEKVCYLSQNDIDKLILNDEFRKTNLDVLSDFNNL